jgi:hypothetical protein
VAIEVGICPVGLPAGENAVVLLWHCEQSPVGGWALSATLYVVAVEYGRVWKPVYDVFATTVFGAIGYCPMPIQTKFLSWQALHPVLIPA